MIEVKYIDRVTWDSELGKQLRALRGRTSRRKLSDETSALGRRVSQPYLSRGDNNAIKHSGAGIKHEALVEN